MLIELNQIDDVCVMRFEGRFVTGVEPEFLRAKSEELKQLGCAKVLADFREVTSVGSTAIGFIVAIYSSVTKNPDGRFVLVGPHPPEYDSAHGRRHGLRHGRPSRHRQRAWTALRSPW